jgi:hypothetical protein
MELTTEQRVLLEGDSQRAQRDLPLLGWGDATDAPDWAKQRILEIRSAIVEKRSVPSPSREYVAGAERRSAALGFVHRLFPSRNEDIELRAKAQSLGEQIRRDAVRTASCVKAVRDSSGRVTHFEPDYEAMQRRTEQEAERIREMRRELFPWEQQ